MKIISWLGHPDAIEIFSSTSNSILYLTTTNPNPLVYREEFNGRNWFSDSSEI